MSWYMISINGRMVDGCYTTTEDLARRYALQSHPIKHGDLVAVMKALNWKQTNYAKQLHNHRLRELADFESMMERKVGPIEV
jgi:hypothetical protein